MDSSVGPPKRVAILGGGLGSLTTAYHLSSQGCDVTVYQLGWRLGGQGASGRNLLDHGRIEEHGLHIWFGFYHNAFRMMREVYEALGRPPDHPLPTVERAFIGEDEHTFLEHVGGGLRRWTITFDHDDDFPGAGDSSLPSLHELVVRLLHRAHLHFQLNLAAHQPAAVRPPSAPETHTFEGLLASVRAGVTRLEGLVVTMGEAAVLEFASRLMERLPEDPTVRPHLEAVLRSIAEHVRTAVEAAAHDELRRAWIILDLAVTYAVGLLADNALVTGLRPLDRWEFREWLTRHGATPSTVGSAIVQAFYDASFSYEDGRTDKPNVAAGVAIRATLRIVFGYQGHIVFKMAAGMGDTIFAPLYEVLTRRGVKFEFFHRVLSLEPGALPGGGARGIAKVHLARQVDLKNGTYSPLVDVVNLPCWPSTPLVYTSIDGEEVLQIVNGDKLEGVNLESYWSGWPDVGRVTLEAGRDYDVVVLGISLGALPIICAPLVAEGEPHRQEWSDLFEQVKTIRTQAVQIWTTLDSGQLGWGVPGGIIACCDEPDASWADFSQLIGREAWPAAASVSGVYYGCGPMPDTEPPIPPPGLKEFPAQELAAAAGTASCFLEASAQPLWPNHATAAGLDPAVIASRYDRANIDPSERYVLAVKGGEFAKLRPGGSGYPNLFLTGSWVDNGLNISSVEGTVMAGMACAVAVSGQPLKIIGEKDL